LTNVPILFTLPHMAAGHQFDLPFFVELWDEKDSHIEEVIALAADYATTCKCERRHQPMIEIERYGERLTGCLDCNCWRGGRSAFIEDLCRPLPQV
jgi:hypothetical protein